MAETKPTEITDARIAEIEANLPNQDGGWYVHEAKTVRALIARLRRTQAELAEARQGLTKAASWFREYETIHKLKSEIGTADKAERNRLRAEFCEGRAALGKESTNDD